MTTNISTDYDDIKNCIEERERIMRIAILKEFIKQNYEYVFKDLHTILSNEFYLNYELEVCIFHSKSKFLDHLYLICDNHFNVFEVSEFNKTEIAKCIIQYAKSLTKFQNITSNPFSKEYFSYPISQSNNDEYNECNKKFKSLCDKVYKMATISFDENVIKKCLASKAQPYLNLQIDFLSKALTEILKLPKFESSLVFTTSDLIVLSDKLN